MRDFSPLTPCPHPLPSPPLLADQRRSSAALRPRLARGISAGFFLRIRIIKSKKRKNSAALRPHVARDISAGQEGNDRILRRQSVKGHQRSCSLADEARRMREERNHQQWIRLAEMSYEQMEEVRRKQREYQQYRERKKAMSQSSSADLGTNHSEMDQNSPFLLGNENTWPNGNYQTHN
ncbi:uncharacterized protein LOC110432200 [Sorghum bicolor]|uniref:uncharacterized protein LOC110432200 n=1 Tax=Sorghum bicolor TaxID=4558 RepID=UPI000B425641|nr:uncharacterized protein LOC110432200 [Sorghum bicolor]|eukprot:XP_021307846.1 uncharacterized protein LOC110432200 [Sorghum bicolor]